MEKVLYAQIGRQRRPIFSADSKCDRGIFDAHKAACVNECIKSGSAMPVFTEELRETEVAEKPKSIGGKE